MNKIKPIKLPKDNGTHDNTIEWWYFNGHLKDAKGEEYSFMDCLFKVDYMKILLPQISNHPEKHQYKRGNYVYFANSVVSDILNKKSYKEIQNISLLSNDSLTRKKFFVNYTNPKILAGFTNSEIEELKGNNFHLRTKDLDLILKCKKNPMLEGGHGYIGTPEAGSYYYSLTDLEANGTLYLDGKEIKVEGQAWMDHQWADATYRKAKWTWFSFQFENGTEMMCMKYDLLEKTRILVNTLDKNGKQKQYKEAKFVPGKNIWKSAKTKSAYPMDWKIEISNAKISIKAKSKTDDGEMICGQINYWEGPLDVVATINGKKVKGKGFMELVGYPSDYNYLLLAGEEVTEDILKKIKKALS